MIVRCETCQTEFSLDDAHVGCDGVTVRCSVCAHVFHVAPVNAQNVSERPWQIRTRDGLLFSASDLAVLQRWISEGRLHPEDEVSRTGNRWVHIGQMPELSGHFARFVEAPSVLRVVDDQRGTQKYSASTQGQAPIFFSPPSHASYAHARESDPSHTNPVFGDRPMASAMPDPSYLVGGSGAESVPAPQRIYSSDSVAPQGYAPMNNPVVHQPQPVVMGPRRITARLNPHLDNFPIGESIEESGTPPQPTPDYEIPQSSNEYQSAELSNSFAHLHHPQKSPSAPRGGSGLQSSYWGVLSLAAVAIVVAIGVRLLVQSREPEPNSTEQIGARETDTESSVSISPQLQAVTRALASMSLGEMRQAEAEIKQLLEGDHPLDSSSRLSLKLALADLLSSRSLLFAMVGSLELQPNGDLNPEYNRLARDDLQQAVRLFDAVELAGASKDQLLPIRIRIRIADGSSMEILNGLLPNHRAVELRALVNASPVWRETGATSDSKSDSTIDLAVVEKIRKIEKPSGLMRCVHALVLARKKDGEGLARALAKLAELAVDNPLIASLQKTGSLPLDGSKLAAHPDPSFDPSSEPSSGAQLDPAWVAAAIDQARQKQSAGEEQAKQENNDRGQVLKADDNDKPETASPPVKERFESLLDRGCNMVERGQNSAGVKILMRAHEMRSRDLEVMLCLGDGYAKMGQHSRALAFFERVLGRSPRHRLALKGAAASAASRSEIKKAVRYYELLLRVEPRNSLAQTYLSVHGPKAPPTPSPSPSPTKNHPRTNPTEHQADHIPNSETSSGTSSGTDSAHGPRRPPRASTNPSQASPGPSHQELPAPD